MADDTARKRKARSRQRETGQKYTEALRESAEPFWTSFVTDQEVVAAREEQLRANPDDAELRGQLGWAYVMTEMGLRWAAANGHEPWPGVTADDIRERSVALTIDVIERYRGVGDPPDAIPSRGVKDSDRGPVLWVERDERVQAALDRAALKYPEMRSAAERYRDDQTEPVLDVLERWQREQAHWDLSGWIEKARAAQADIEARSDN